MKVRVVDQGPPSEAALAVVGAVLLNAIERFQSAQPSPEKDGPKAA